MSHRLPEVFGVADAVTVLRNGEVVTSGALSSYTHDSIIEAIVGRHIEAYYRARNETPAKEVLAVTELSGGGVQDFSFTSRRGEILGLTGIAGAGFEEVPYLLFDNARHAQGICVIDGQEISLKSASVAERVRRGMVLVPAVLSLWGGFRRCRSRRRCCATVLSSLSHHLASRRNVFGIAMWCCLWRSGPFFEPFVRQRTRARTMPRVEPASVASEDVVDEGCWGDLIELRGDVHAAVTGHHDCESVAKGDVKGARTIEHS